MLTDSDGGRLFVAGSSVGVREYRREGGSYVEFGTWLGTLSHFVLEEDMLEVTCTNLTPESVLQTSVRKIHTLTRAAGPRREVL